jgi:hypothetical protein
MVPSRSRRQDTLYGHAVLAALMLAAVLIARSIPPSFPPVPSTNSSIQAITHHDQRPRFEHNRAQWSAPKNAFLPAPPTPEFAPVAASSRVAFTLLAKGWHYNRPPPSGSPS